MKPDTTIDEIKFEQDMDCFYCSVRDMIKGNIKNEMESDYILKYVDKLYYYLVEGHKIRKTVLEELYGMKPSAGDNDFEDNLKGILIGVASKYADKTTLQLLKDKITKGDIK